MLHSGHLNAKVLIGNGLTAKQTHHLGVRQLGKQNILWSSPPLGLSSSLNFHSTAIQFVTPRMPSDTTRVGFKYTGELVNEDEAVLGGQELAGVSIKGHYPEKDGIIACLLATEALAARRQA